MQGRGAAKRVKIRCIDWAECGALVDSLAEKVRSGGTHFDLVVGIARGGLPVALAISDQLGAKFDMISVKSYTGISKRGEVKIISKLTENIRGKNVLVVDDLVDQGDTIIRVLEYLARYKPKRIQTAMIFKKPWSKKEPDYWLEVVDKWIVFPWERGEFGRKKQ